MWAHQLCAQTYFNERFPPKFGTYGNGSANIVLGDSGYFCSTYHARISDDGRETTICKLSLPGDELDMVDSLQFADRHVYSLGLSNGDTSELVEAHTFISNGVSRIGFSIYNNLGQRVHLFEDTVD